MDLLSKWQNLSSAKHIPFQASLELTNKCNERCLHCYIDEFKDDPNKVLKFEDWSKILTELRSAGTLYIILMGGEAMLNPHFYQIAAQSTKLGFHTSVITNGLLIKSIEDAYKLKEHGIRQVTFSVYSLSSELHDQITQVRGSLDRTLSALHFCLKAGLEVGVNCLLNRETIADYPRLYHYFKELGITVRDDVTITSKFSGDLSPTKLRATNEQLIHYYKFKKSLLSSTNGNDPTEYPTDHVCNVAKGKCAVTAYGDLLGCIEVREALGNLLESDFHTLWNSHVAQKWRRIKNSDLKGYEQAQGNCNHCLGMAQNELGDPLEILPYSKEVWLANKEALRG